MRPLFVLALACAPSEGDRTWSNVDDSWHLLISGQMILADFDHPGIFELDEDLELVWSLPLEGSAGGFGASRLPGQQTLAAWTDVTTVESGAGVFDAEGQGVWSWPEDQLPLSFPHGLDMLDAETVMMADAWTGKIQALGLDGGLQWEVSDPKHSQGPSGAAIGQIDGRPMLLATMLGDGDGSAYSRNDRVVAWWLDGSLPEQAWLWPREPDADSALWVHGPQFLLDGTILVSSAGQGQVIRLDAGGGELGRCPPSDSDLRFTFPREAVILPDGRMLVMDATEFLLVEDPWGDPVIQPGPPILFGYSARLLFCGRGECLGG